MRLLELQDNGELSLAEFVGDSIPPYAILSHTWREDREEVSFQDIREGTYKNKAGYTKIQLCGEQAAKDSIRYFWVDTCCIDKTSSSELSEAINSMFRWYKESRMCYVYLEDVATIPRLPNHPDSPDMDSMHTFHESRWFRRGWTLQELLAPNNLQSFNKSGPSSAIGRSFEILSARLPAFHLSS